jgi:hypothetical protein
MIDNYFEEKKSDSLAVGTSRAILNFSTVLLHFPILWSIGFGGLWIVIGFASLYTFFEFSRLLLCFS